MVNYKDYMLKKTSREKENIEWSISYSYNSRDNESPRVLLIGDSICNGYQPFVRENLGEYANVTYWISSKCVTDPMYLRELDFYLDAFKYDMIFFNNGAHSSDKHPEERETAFANTIDFIMAKCPGVPLVLVNCAPGRPANLTERFKKFNEFTDVVAKEKNLPIIDLFTPMEATDKSVTMRDDYHWTPESSAVQGKFISDYVMANLKLQGGLTQEGSETGPSGAIK